MRLYKSALDNNSTARAQSAWNALANSDKFKKDFKSSIMFSKPPPVFHIIESPEINAYAYTEGPPRHRKRVVAITRGLADLVASQSEQAAHEDLKFIFGHECAHIYFDDLSSIPIASHILIITAVVAGIILILNKLILLSIALSAVSYFLNLLVIQFQSQQRELRADKYACQFSSTEAAKRVVSLFYFHADTKISKFLSFFSTHPLPQQRILAISKIKS